MWLKLGTRGEPKVLYLIAIFLIYFYGSTWFYSLYDLNNGPEKEKMLFEEATAVFPINEVTRIQGSKVEEHLGGGRDFELTVFSDYTEKELYEVFLAKANKKQWQQISETEFEKNGIKMKFKFLNISEYKNAKHLQGKSIARVRLEID